MSDNFDVVLTLKSESLSYSGSINEALAGQIIMAIATGGQIASQPVDQENGADTSRQKKANKPRKAAPVKAEAIVDEIKALDLHPDYEDKPNYWDYPKKGQRVMWLLGIADKAGLAGLTPKEIEFLAAQLKDKIEAKNVNGMTTSFIKIGRIARAGDNYKALKKGLDFLTQPLSSED